MACRTCPALGSSSRCTADTNSASDRTAVMSRYISSLPGRADTCTTPEGYDIFGAAGPAAGAAWQPARTRRATGQPALRRDHGERGRWWIPARRRLRDVEHG